MKALGIIAEYNPFHNGHLYQINRAREVSQADLVVVCQSGNFLQRGEPAIYDKWHRAKWAVQSGADLVLELPLPFSIQSADYFAQAGVRLLDQLGVDQVAFGVESGQLEDFQGGARHLVDHAEDFASFLNQSPREKSYHELIMDWLASSDITRLPDLSQPNNILAFTYIKAAYQAGLDFRFFPIKRIGANYHDDQAQPGAKIASATAIRKKIYQGQAVQNYLPKAVLQDLFRLPPVKPQDFWPFIQYKVWNMTEAEMDKIYDMKPGLSQRLKKAVLQAKSLKDFFSLTTSRQLSHNRIKRLALYCLLDLYQDQVEELNQIGPSYIRPLAFNSLGQTYLGQIKSSLTLPLVTKLSQDLADKLALDIKAGELYRLARVGDLPKQDFTRKPYMSIDKYGDRKYT